AWGLWAASSGMTGHLGRADLARMTRAGIAPLTCEQGLALFDTGIALDTAVVVPARLDMTVLRAQAGSGTLPALLRTLVRPARRPPAAGPAAGSASSLRGIAGLPVAEQDRVLLDLVGTTVATVLGHSARDNRVNVDPKRAFSELGFDSLTA